jgi:sugar lactone lactonase YvrE
MATLLPVWDLRAELGEGPVWDERDKALWFTDIKRQKIHRYDPATGARRSWDSPEQAGFVLPAQGGGFAAGMQSGLYRVVPEF